jgi:hypothetical protein
MALCFRLSVAPVVGHEDAAATVARRIGPVHRDPLNLGSKAKPDQMPVRLVTGHVHPGQQLGHPNRCGKRLACMQQSIEGLSSRRSRAHGPELDEVSAIACLAARPMVAHGETVQARPRRVPEQDSGARASGRVRSRGRTRTSPVPVPPGRCQRTAGKSSQLPADRFRRARG